MPVTLVFLPAADIGSFVGLGNCHIGITGQDIIAETKERGQGAHKMVEEVKLGFGACRLSLQMPEARVAELVDAASGTIPREVLRDELAGRAIGTSFVELARRYVDDLWEETGSKRGRSSTKPSIRQLSGSVEAAVQLGVASAVIDLVESGETMRAAGLAEADVVLRSESVLISSGHMSPEHQKVAEMLLRRIKSVLAARAYVLIEYNAPRTLLTECMAITPGRRAPTLSPLDDSDWVSVSAMIPSKDKHEIMDRLHDVGAVDIFVASIQNCRV
jgi:ATP phosphoribosyltransferase